MNEIYRMNDSLSIIGEILKQQGLTLATAESCTGGLLSSALTASPGSSAYFLGGIVSYANSVKQDLLGVELALLNQFGAVSEPVAQAMAQGAKRIIGSDLALGITGIAGPDSDQTNKKVGLVYIGMAHAHGTQVTCFHFIGDRDNIRQQSVTAALSLLLIYLRKIS